MTSRTESVLVVDDDIRILRIMQRILELEGYRVLKAENGESALRIFDSETPGLILLDIMMPGMDGYTICQRMREFSRVPIIMVTARAGDEDKVLGLDAGADDYITKPFSASELAARVRAALRRSALTIPVSTEAVRRQPRLDASRIMPHDCMTKRKECPC